MNAFTRQQEGAVQVTVMELNGFVVDLPKDVMMFDFAGSLLSILSASVLTNGYLMVRSRESGIKKTIFPCLIGLVAMIPLTLTSFKPTQSHDQTKAKIM
eukprot:763426-Hanusia_phi.AAC.4